MNLISQIFKPFLYFSIVLIGITSCIPESEDLTLGPIPTSIFTITPVSGENNTYLLTNTTPGGFVFKWNTGNGFNPGSQSEKIFLPDAGVYKVSSLVMTNGGTAISEEQTITVETSDPVAGNLVVGGKMEEGDDVKWKHLTFTNGVTFELTDGKMVASGGGWGHAAIYQAINVEANKKYKFSMNVSGSGATDTWFEVYFGLAAPPVDGLGQDYSSNGKKFGLNTWAGCGKEPFNGDLALIGCDAELANAKGEISFAESGTVYLLIKSGGANLGEGGISIDNVELRGSK